MRFRPSLIVILFATLNYLVNGAPVYETNDDVCRSMLAAGVGFCDQPDVHLTFSHIALGYVESALYRLNGDFPWHGVMLASFLVFSLSVIAQELIRERPKGQAVCLLVVFLLGVCLRPLNYIQFTTVAALMASAGTLVSLRAIEAPGSKRELVTGFLLTCFAALIRPESAKLVLSMTAGLLLIRFLWPLRKKSLILGGAYLLICSSSIVGLQFINGVSYKKSGWAEFLTVNPLVANLMEYKTLDTRSQKNIRAMERLGWSPLDLRLFYSWYLLDESKYGIDTLQRLDQSTYRYTDYRDLKLRLRSSLQALKVILFTDTTIVPLTLICFGWPLFTRTKLFWYQAVAYFTLQLSALLYLALWLKLAPHAIASLLSFSAVSLMRESWNGSSFKTAASTGLQLICITIVVCVLLGITSYQKSSRRGTDEHELLVRDLEALSKSCSSALYVSWGSGFPYQAIRPFDSLSCLRGLKLLSVSGIGRCPVVTERLREFRITNVLEALCRADVALIADENTRDCIANYYWIQHRALPRFEKLFDDPSLPINVSKIASLEIIPSQSLQLRTTAKDLVLFPNPRIGWRYEQMKPIDKSSFASVGSTPLMSLMSPLSKRVGDIEEIRISVSLDPWVFRNRKTLVQLQLNSHKTKEFFIPLVPDGGMHSYSFKLSNLGLEDSDRITHINVLPVYIQDYPTKFSVSSVTLVAK